jgi:methionine sulfoxide reductase heme-binding subunit
LKTLRSSPGRTQSRPLGVHLLQLLPHLLAWVLLSWLVFDFFTGNLTVNPIQAATQRLGRYALVFLTLGLSITPLSRLFGYRPLLKLARPFGLYTFFFAALHLLVFVGVDYRFDWALLLTDVASKKYIWAGLPALLIITALALTSTRGWMRRLGKNWKRLHRLVYLAAILDVLHFAWVRKGALFSLRGDVRLPLLFALLVLVLLLLRLPPLHRWSARFSRRFR